MLIQDPFDIIQNLQKSPIPQTNLLPWNFFALETQMAYDFEIISFTHHRAWLRDLVEQYR